MIYVFQIYGCIELRFKIPHVCHILKKKKKKKLPRYINVYLDVNLSK